MMENELRSVVASTNSTLEELRDAHELLKKNHMKTLERLSAAENRAMEADANQERMSAEHRAMYQEWNSQLNTQADEFKNLEALMVPQHQVHMAKLAFGDTIRAGHQKELENIRSVNDSLRGTLVQSRKEARMYKVELDGVISERDSSKARYEQETSSLKDDLMTSRSQIEDNEGRISELNESIRKLEGRLTELTIANKYLTAEVESVTHDAEEAMQARADLEISQIKTVKELQSQTSLMNAQMECANDKAHSAVTTRDQVIVQLRTTEIDNRKIRIQLIELQQNMEEMRSFIDTQTELQNKELRVEQQKGESLQKHFEHEIENYQNRISILEHNSQLDKIDFDKREQKRETMFRSEVDSINECLESSQLKCARLQLEVQQKQDEAMKESIRNEEMTAKMSLEISDIKASLEAKTEDLDRVNRDHENTMNELNSLKATVDLLTQKHNQEGKSLKQCRDDLASAIEDNTQLHEAVSRFQSKISTLEGNTERDAHDWRCERQTLAQKIRMQNDQAQSLKETILKLESDSSHTQTTLEGNIQKLKKDRQHHKQISKELRDRLTNLIRELAAVKDRQQDYTIHGVSSQTGATL